MNTDKKAPTARRLTSRQIAFAQLVASGETQSGSYRRAYKHPKMPDQTAAEKGCKLAANPRVRAEVERLRNRVEVKKLLTLNDRLEILSQLAQNPKNRPHEVARAIEVYSKISGDQAPERHEVTGAGGGPIPVAATAVVSVGRIPVRERMEMMRAARAASKAAEAKG